MNRHIAELVGTFVLVLGGCGSAVLAGDQIGFLGVSLAFGLSLLVMAYAFGPISGCHIKDVLQKLLGYKRVPQSQCLMPLPRTAG